jgi:hypothetical protein
MATDSILLRANAKYLNIHSLPKNIQKIPTLNVNTVARVSHYKDINRRSYSTNTATYKHHHDDKQEETNSQQHAIHASILGLRPKRQQI